MQQGIPQTVARFIAEKKEYANKQLNLQSWPIHSVVRFAAGVVPGPPVVATIDTAPRVAFSYGLNGDMAPAGRPGVLATPADTTLQNPGQTKDQADVFIYGLSAMVAGGEVGFLRDLFRETDVAISTTANVTIPIGTMDMYPQPGGLFGGGNSALLEPGLSIPGGVDNGEGAQVLFATNGNPTAGSFRKLDSPLFWAGVGSGPDSNLQLICTPRRPIIKTSSAFRGAGAGISAFTPITAALAYVDIKWVLHAVSVQIRGSNQ
ncbi:MAG: hypothetical protein JWL95_3236 [Gemmatimonadetes bacterium]|nr:hypothetical protein [Gemmatimonadota bacterium]